MRRTHRVPNWGIFPLAGWLFTDLLLAMMVIFLVASATGVPTKIQPRVTPTATALPCLEHQYRVLQLSVDDVGLLSGAASAFRDVEQQVRAFTPIHGRRAGLVIAYGGSPTLSTDDTNRGKQVAGRVNQALQDLGKHGYVFVGTAYHDPLNYFGVGFNVVKLEIYLFALPGQCSV